MGFWGESADGSLPDTTTGVETSAPKRRVDMTAVGERSELCGGKETSTARRKTTAITVASVAVGEGGGVQKMRRTSTTSVVGEDGEGTGTTRMRMEMADTAINIVITTGGFPVAGALQDQEESETPIGMADNDMATLTGSIVLTAARSSLGEWKKMTTRSSLQKRKSS